MKTFTTDFSCGKQVKAWRKYNEDRRQQRLIEGYLLSWTVAVFLCYAIAVWVAVKAL